MSAHRSVAALLGLALGLCACQTESTHPRFLTDNDRLKHVTEIAELYTQAVRWSRDDLAIEHVQPALRNAWREVFTADQRGFAFSGHQIESIDLSPEPTRVDVRVVYESYSESSLTEKRIREHQIWTFDTEARRWFVTPDLGAFEQPHSAGRSSHAPRGS